MAALWGLSTIASGQDFDGRTAALLRQLELNVQEARGRLELTERQYERAGALATQSREALAAAERRGDAAAARTAREALRRAEAAQRRAQLLLERAQRQARGAEHTLEKIGTLARSSRTDRSGSAAAAAGIVSASGGEIEITSADGRRRPFDTQSLRGLASGDELRTGSGAQAEIFLEGGANRLVLDQKSRLAFREEPAATWVELLEGRLHLLLKKLSKEYKIRTPHAVLGVRGTEFTLVTDPPSGRTTLVVLSGRLVVEPAGGAGEPLAQATAGQELVLRADGTIEARRTIDPESVDPWWERSP